MMANGSARHPELTSQPGSSLGTLMHQNRLDQPQREETLDELSSLRNEKPLPVGKQAGNLPFREVS